MKKSEIVICPNCNNIQEEPDILVDDKFSWKCRSCDGIFENDKPHLLQKIAKFDYDRRNVFTGMGGIGHKIINEK